MKTKQIIEAQSLWTGFREFLRRICILIMMIGLGTIMFGLACGALELINDLYN